MSPKGKEDKILEENKNRSTLIDKLNARLKNAEYKYQKRNLRCTIEFYSQPFFKSMTCPQCGSKIIHKDYNYYACECNAWVGKERTAKLWKLEENGSFDRSEDT